MNLIGNTCVASYIIRDYVKEEFKNPFTWAWIDANNFYKLIENYNTLNFNNIDIKIDNELKSCILIINNLITVNYTHYFYDENCKKITNKKVNVYYNKIKDWLNEKYYCRLNRMIQENNKPIFMIASGIIQRFYTKDEIYNIQKLCNEKNYKLITHQDETLNTQIKCAKYIIENNIGNINECYSDKL